MLMLTLVYDPTLLCGLHVRLQDSDDGGKASRKRKTPVKGKAAKGMR
jgi:hypothetical protein